MTARPQPGDVDLELLGRGEEHSIAAFLAGRGAGAHLVASRALRDALPVDPAGAFTWSETLADVPAGARTVHVDSPDDERGLLAQARARFPAARVLGLRHHLAPMLSSDRQPLKDVPDSFDPAALRRYAIVCTGRSGGTFLSQLLIQAGLGKPREHLRHALAAALRAPGVDRAEAWRQLAWRARAGDIFGSRLAGQFLVAAAGADDVPALLSTLVPDDLPVVALRRPIDQTVVSRFVAARGDASSDDAPDYDFDALSAVLARNRAENRAIEAALAARPRERVLDVSWAELERQPVRTLERIAGFVGIAPRLGSLNLDALPTRSATRSAPHAALGERFIEELRQCGEDVDDLVA